MLKIYRGGFHADLHGRLKNEIEGRIENEKQVFLVVPEMETLIAEEEAMREYVPSAPRFFEVTNFTRLANTVFRHKGGLAKDSYDKTAKALLMWRALSEAMPLLSENTRSDITPGMVERALHAVSEMEQLGLDKEQLLAVRDDESITANARLSGKLSDLIYTLSFYGQLLSEDGSVPSDLIRMEKMLRGDASLFADASFYFEGFTSFTEPQLRILALLMERTEVTVALRLPKHMSDSFEYTETRATAERLKTLATERRIAVKPFVLDTNHMIKNEALLLISRYLWTQNVSFDKDSLQNLGDGLRIFCARTPYEECSFVANDIARRIREGGARYNDFAIVARDINTYKESLGSALRESGIPAFLSREVPITSFEGVKLIDLAFRAIFSGFSRGDVIAYAKCGLVGLTREETDTFEMYVDAWGIHSNAFLNENAFMANPLGYTDRASKGAQQTLATVAKARDAIITPLTVLREDTARVQTVREHAHALVDFLVRIGLEERLAEQSEHLLSLGESTLSSEIARLWRSIVGVLDKVVEVLDDFRVDARGFASLLNIAFSSIKVGRLPEAQDEVTLGSANSLRLYHKKHIYLIGVNNGEFPANVSDGSYFTERERQTLRDIGLATEPPAQIRCAKEQFFFTRAFLSASDTVTLLYTEKNASFKSTPPASVITHLIEATTVAEDDGTGRTRKIQLIPIQKIDTLPLLSRVSTPRGAIDVLAQGHSREEEEAILHSLNRAGESELVKLSHMPIFNASLSLSGELARQVFPEVMDLTQSRLESFADCPLHHFLRYVLALGEEREVKMDALGIGNMVHGILEKFFARAKENGADLSSYPREHLGDEVAQISEEYLDSIGFYSELTPKKRVHTAKRIAASAVAVIHGLLDELSSSKYIPAFFELKIERNRVDAPAPHTVEGDDGVRVYLYGTIDRVDTYEKDGEVFVRVIDYKTGSKTFSPSDLAEGKNLQMFLYLASLLESKSFRTKLGVREDGTLVGGGVIYVQTALDSKEMPDENFDPMATLLKNQKRSGMVLWEEDSLSAMHPDYLPITLKKDGTPDARSAERTYTRESFGELMQTVDGSIRRIAHDMRGGVISASPLKGHAADTCERCPYRPVCRKTR